MLCNRKSHSTVGQLYFKNKLIGKRDQICGYQRNGQRKSYTILNENIRFGYINLKKLKSNSIVKIMRAFHVNLPLVIAGNEWF